MQSQALSLLGANPTALVTQPEPGGGGGSSPVNQLTEGLEGFPRGMGPHPREVRAFFSCLTQSTIPSPLSKLKRRPDSLEATQWAPRDLRRDLRGERHPWLALEARPDSPGESGTPP